MDSEELALCYLPATEAIRAFKAKTLSPVDLMTAIIKRCEQVNPKLNAFTYTFFDRALDQAKAAEERYMKNEGVRPLEGIPCGIKDFHPVEGEITTYGSPIFRDYRPDFTAPTIERLLEAGAIMHCRTTTPELAHSGVTHSLLWGVTRNPWNTEYSPGGSSGGASAALAAGMSTICDGTDGGGSCRIPASMAGVVGYKPPQGRNPISPEFAMELFLHYGPITRTVADAALMQNIMSGQHNADITTVRERVVLPEQFEGVEGWKIAFSMDLGYFEIDTQVQKNTRKAGEVFKSLGAEVDEVDVGWDFGVLEAWMTHWQGICAGLAAEHLPRWRYEMEPFLVWLIEEGKRRAVGEYYRVNIKQGEMYAKLAPILDHYNVLICPTISVPALKADHQNDDPDFRINGKKQQAYIQPYLTYPFNMMAWCPTISVPSGLSEDGLPTGLQIIGRTYDDLSVFRAAAAFEQAQPWLDKPERRPHI